ncbi:type IV pilus modification PilV family protein [Kushneria indalinina]|uniref:Prepilin-type N-terminal cleavage/methylation domain-containing protein n=1 Tax=Kushneria indalinina DSM 14324 TaxID=1122140 RepID=A0A3D9DX25_9GAMM|nr:prepilin-type N-terminal cleavage/methylation domain-containing protein [Kushneria indalinina]REC94929.1 prepilin-type N-terminal cleavage/methylation domain-containing protein [Kushneria indalinina DSM 14324]
MRPVIRHDQAGFGLLEPLIAMLIIGIAAMGLLALTTRNMQQSTLSHERSMALGQASNLMEQLWTGLCTLPDQGFVTIESQWREQMRSPAANPLLQPHWAAAIKHSPVDGELFYRVEATIFWGGREQSRHQVDLITILPRVECS